MRYINLVNPEFRKRREPLSLLTLAVALGAVIVVLAGGHYFARQRADGIGRQLADVESKLRAERDKVVAAGKVLAAKPDPKLTAEVEATRAALQARQAALAELAGGALGDTEGFGEQFRAFARQSVSGLWLTGFTLSGAGREILIQGRALSPELIPAYIRRMSSEAAFRGKSFASLSIEEGKADAAPRPAPSPPAGAAPSAAARVPYVEFRLVSTASETAATPGSAGKDIPALRGIVEGKR